MYTWPARHPKEYLGAAHGVMGIMYVLLHLWSDVASPEHRRAVLDTLTWLLENAEQRVGTESTYDEVVPTGHYYAKTDDRRLTVSVSVVHSWSCRSCPLCSSGLFGLVESEVVRSCGQSECVSQMCVVLCR